jgi:CheY-like chemotaxis protein
LVAVQRHVGLKVGNQMPMHQSRLNPPFFSNAGNPACSASDSLGLFHDPSQKRPLWPKVDPAMTAQTKIVTVLENAKEAPFDDHIERRRHKRVKVAVCAHVCGGSASSFEEVVTTMEVSRQGVLLSTTHPGYSVGDELQVTCPYWNTPTAINVPRTAKLIRCTKTRNANFAVAFQYLISAQDKSSQADAGVVHGLQKKFLGVRLDAQLTRSLRELLEKDGYDVVLASSPQQALKILKTVTPDVIAAEAEGEEDISGNDLCAIVKTSTRLQHIPVILLTRSALPSNYTISRQLGAVVCMTVPCEAERLRRAVLLVAPPAVQRSAYSATVTVPTPSQAPSKGNTP